MVEKELSNTCIHKLNSPVLREWGMLKKWESETCPELAEKDKSIQSQVLRVNEVVQKVKQDNKRLRLENSSLKDDLLKSNIKKDNLALNLVLYPW